MVRIRNRLERPGTYGFLPSSLLPSHCTPLSSIALLGPVSPTTSYHYYTSPHARSITWQGGEHVIPL